jgi:hypothetical protein
LKIKHGADFIIPQIPQHRNVMTNRPIICLVKNFFQIDYPAPRAQGIRQFDAASLYQKFLNYQQETIHPCAKRAKGVLVTP